MRRSERFFNSLLFVLLINLFTVLPCSISTAHGKAPALFAAGDNTSGQLGDDTTTDRPTPVRVKNANGVKAASAGANHSLYVMGNGSLWAVGRNAYGQLGIDSTDDQSMPVQVLVNGVVDAVSAGANHSLYVMENGSLWAMGDNWWGELGDGTTTPRSTPVQVKNENGTYVEDVLGVAAGVEYSLYVKKDGSLWAMGNNWYGQFGNGGTTSLPNPVPQKIKPSGVISAAAGFEHSLYIKDGTLWAMGGNWAGQLGDGTTTPRLAPIQVPVGTGAVLAMAAGSGHSLYVKEDGSLWAMGSNSNGQIGDGNGGPGVKQTTPVRIESSGVIAVSAGAFHSLYVKEDGSIWAMGFNDHGQLGDGTKVDRLSPVQIKGHGGAAVSGGEYFSLYSYFIDSMAPILPILLF